MLPLRCGDAALGRILAGALHVEEMASGNVHDREEGKHGDTRTAGAERSDRTRSSKRRAPEDLPVPSSRMGEVPAPVAFQLLLEGDTLSIQSQQIRW